MQRIGSTIDGILGMFTGSQKFIRHSVTRLAISGVLHLLIVLGALLSRVDSTSYMSHPRATHVTLIAPRPRVVTAVNAATLVPKSPRPHSIQAFAISTPTPANRTLSVITLPEVAPHAIAPPPQVAMAIAAALPPAPVVLGRLSSVEAIPERTSVRTTHIAGFASATQFDAAHRTSLVARAGFGDSSVRTNSEPAPEPRRPASTPVEILSKPRPVYSEEARRLRIEGEVLLEVLFAASGEPHVLRVIQGLGHGLEAAAMESASHIGFRPAVRAGEPIDQVATVRIVFQLAY